MNLYMPGKFSKEIRRAQSELEQIFRNTFHRIARDIVMDKQLACTFLICPILDLILKRTLEKEAHENQGNTLLSDEQYFCEICRKKRKKTRSW